jgi:DNA-binding transcriptional LysR family regulator
MEMHQVRYFLAVARTSNFTRAAEECNVAQPSLTRAIKLLEGEFDGDLFRRERPAVMLTPLGEKMYPLLKQCYDSAQSARALAILVNEGQIGTLKLAVSSSIELGLILPHVNALCDHFREVELKILRGTAPQLVELLKSGEVELAIAASVEPGWDRLDNWKLYEEPFEIVFSRSHRLADKEEIEVDDLRPERFLVRTHCESCAEVKERLQLKGLVIDHRHEVSSDQDLISLLELKVGVSVLPQTVSAPQTLLRTALKGVDLQRNVYLYGVAGRQRSPVAGTFMKMLRAASWPKPH